MDNRPKYLTNLHSYIEGIDKEVTMILQSLQWDRKHLLEGPIMVACKYDQNHRVPPDKKEDHEKECLLKSQGYCKSDKLLPDPLDPNANTLVKLCKAEIEQIISNASKNDPLFKIGPGSQFSEPLSLERLQATYTADERRAIHDAVVTAVPCCHNLTDLALQCASGEEQNTKPKSRMEILAELRDMKRRRTKYRGSTKSRNYSDVLRDVISTQMELYTGTQADVDQTATSENGTNKDAVGNAKGDRSHDKNSHKPDEARNERRDLSKDTFKERESYSRDRKKYDDFKNHSHREDKDKYSRTDRSKSRYNNDYKNNSGRSSHSFRNDFKEDYSNKRIKQEGDRSKSKDRYERRSERDQQSRSRDSSKYYEKYDTRDDRYDHRSDKYLAGSSSYTSGKRRHDNDNNEVKHEKSDKFGPENYRRYYDTDFKSEELSYDDRRKRKYHS